MFTAVLFTLAKRWTQFKYPCTDEWINKMLPMHIMGHCSALKKGRNSDICYNTDAP